MIFVIRSEDISIEEQVKFDRSRPYVDYKKRRVKSLVSTSRELNFLLR